MGFFDNLFNPKKEIKKQKEIVNSHFKMINGYTPVFTTFEGSLYEMDLTRSVIHAFATHCSKLNFEVNGNANTFLGKRLKTKANEIMDTSKYLYRLATILEVTNNALIIPIKDELSDKIVGFYPYPANDARVVEFEKELYIVFDFLGKKTARPINEIGIINQYQFRNEFFGDDNNTLSTTLDLMHKQEQGMKEAIRNGATISFMGQIANVLREDDLDKERKRFSKQNLTNNSTGMLLFDSKYKEVKQIEHNPYVIDEKQMQQIKENVYSHFGINEKILQNSFNSQEWASYYEGKIEPFAIKASLVHSNLTFTDREQAHDNMIMLTANRLQYLSNDEKLRTVTQLFDRGFLTHNQGREIYNMAPIEGGDKYYIRKEYSETIKLDSEDVEFNDLEESEENE